ncbi:S-methyl-5-thioribose kinase [Cytobacillus sp. FJAT-54145]|uniref:Methylthioribose kinase n=1 Tax=Cytobacillus spartinae TaxID=3299023 RepID=A0ABW6KH54_9BACI
MTLQQKQQQQTYEPLTESTAIELAKKLNLFSDQAVLQSTEIGDGNLNLVFRIVDQENNQSVIIKQALPYAKVVGESWPLTLKRATIESDALKIFKDIAPDFVPEVYFADEELAITVMEDLSHLIIARTGFIQGNDYPLLSAHLGKYLARTLFLTSDFGLKPAKKKELVGQFINPELCKITEDLIFTDPFFDAPTNNFEQELLKEVNQIWNDQQLKFQVALLKKSFLTDSEALLHGDLHTGSIFVSEEETKVIDPEFAYFGPIGFDLGQVIANLLFQAIANSEKREVIYNHIEVFWTTFVKDYEALWNSQNEEPLATTEGYLSFLLEKALKDAIGFAGCELIRRTIGLAHVADLDGIQDDTERIEAKRTTLSIGRELIVNRNQFTSIQQLLSSL